MYEAETDIDPRHEAFWFFGGNPPPERIRNIRRKDWQRQYADDPVNRSYYYTGKPLLTLRHEHPLESPMEFEHFTAEDVSKVPEYTLDPFTAGYSNEHNPAITVPGNLF